MAQTAMCDGHGLLTEMIITIIDVLEHGRAYAPDFYDAISLKNLFCADLIDVDELRRGDRLTRFAIISRLHSHRQISSADVKALTGAEFRVATDFNVSGTAISAGAVLILRSDGNSLDLEQLQIAAKGRLVKQPPQPPVHGRIFQTPTKPHGNETWIFIPGPGVLPLNATFELQADGTLKAAAFIVESGNG